MAVEQAGATWRPPVRFRITVSIFMALFSVMTGSILWGALTTGWLPVWGFTIITVPLWLWLAHRVWTLSATLGPDALIVRNLLSTRRILLTDITAAGIASNVRGQWAHLIVTAQDRRYSIYSVVRNEYTFPDRPFEADEAVDAIRAAAALSRS